MAAPKRRSLEEFFSQGMANGSEREDYVTVETPEKVVNKSATATSVLDKKTGKTKVDNAVIGVDGRIEEKQVEAPKVVEAPAPVAPKPSGDRVYQSPAVAPIQTKTQSYGDPQPVDTGSAWERALIGATPLLVGFLTGNKLEGMQVASKHVVADEGDRYKRGKDFNSKLAEMKAKRDMAGGTLGKVSGKTFEYQGSDGQNRIGRFVNGQQFIDERQDPLAPLKSSKDSIADFFYKDKDGVGRIGTRINGKRVMSPDDPVKYEKDQFSFQTVGDASTKDEFDSERIIVKNGQYEGTLGGLAKKPVEMREDGKDRRFEEAQMNQVVKDFRNKNSKFGVAQDDALNIVKAADMLNKPNPFSDEGVKTFLARSVFAEKGPLSDSDLMRLAGSGALDEKGVRAIQRWRDGQRITDNDARAMRAVLEAVYPYIKQKAMGELEGTVKAYPDYAAKLGPRLRAYVDGNFPTLPEWANPSRDGVKTKGITVPSVDKKPIMQNGHIYNWNSKTGEYE